MLALDDQPLAGCELEDLVASCGDELVFRHFLCPAPVPAIVVENDDTGRHEAVEECVESANLGRGAVHVEVTGRRSRRGAILENLGPDSSYHLDVLVRPRTS